jgi:hypothetical protein
MSQLLQKAQELLRQAKDEHRDDISSKTADIVRQLYEPPFCRRCFCVLMKEGTVLQNQAWVHADSPGDYSGPLKDAPEGACRGQTVSSTGPAVEVPCWKCPECGHSITK